ncbi:MAG TPA: LLM class flavin-dependent oxidoreductase [Acidimicrobiia bacterium]|nr:LLM class flavin-dependent oxidoreductase [Acidimicrobiia bacterium]
MRIGIGLPNAIPGTPGSLVATWAARAEEQGFALLASIDRIVYGNGEPLASLTAAAAVTATIELFTDILLAATRQPVPLAKQAATLDWLSGGRLTLGLAPGGRQDDFAVAGMRFTNRGRRFDATLDTMVQTWRGELVGGANRPIGPRPARGEIPMLIGGTSPQAIARVARVGSGWTAGSGAGDMIGPLISQVHQAWGAAGRSGTPRISRLTYFALGDNVRATAEANLHDYYGPRADAVLSRTCWSPEQARAFVANADGLGVGEVVFFPAVGDLSQVDRLADAVL